MKTYDERFKRAFRKLFADELELYVEAMTTTMDAFHEAGINYDVPVSLQSVTFTLHKRVMSRLSGSIPYVPSEDVRENLQNFRAYVEYHGAESSVEFVNLCFLLADDYWQFVEGELIDRNALREEVRAAINSLTMDAKTFNNVLDYEALADLVLLEWRAQTRRVDDLTNREIKRRRLSLRDLAFGNGK